MYLMKPNSVLVTYIHEISKAQNKSELSNFPLIDALKSTSHQITLKLPLI